MSLSIYSETERLGITISVLLLSVFRVSFLHFQRCQNDTPGDVEITLQEMSNIHRRKG